VGVTPHQGDREIRSQGKGRQEEYARNAKGWQAAECISPVLFPELWDVSLESRVRLTSPARFGKGATEKDESTSPVPYFIWSGGKAEKPYLSLLI
jgi:hypothetical protein